MAMVTVTDTGRVLEHPGEISAFLARHGIWYRRFDGVDRLGDDASPDQILAAFAEPIGALKSSGGYVTADVIDVKPDTPGLAAMLAKFNKEHWHDEDEVRFIVRGRGVFHIHPRGGPVFRIEVREGDMINVPAGTWHWFDLCGESRIRAIRLFRDAAGWTPHYTGSGEDAQHEPLCFGPTYIPPAGVGS
jgi:1,2-dihydroxy-3-keto-5-methylthiopentene dioxygenase